MAWFLGFTCAKPCRMVGCDPLLPTDLLEKPVQSQERPQSAFLRRRNLHSCGRVTRESLARTALAGFGFRVFGYGRTFRIKGAVIPIAPQLVRSSITNVYWSRGEHWSRGEQGTPLMRRLLRASLSSTAAEPALLTAALGLPVDPFFVVLASF